MQIKSRSFVGGKFIKQYSKSCLLELIIITTLKQLCSFYKIVNRLRMMEWTKEREWTDEWSVMGRVFVEDRVFRDGKDKQRIGIVYISIIVCKFGFSFAYVYTRRTKSNFPTSSWIKRNAYIFTK